LGGTERLEDVLLHDHLYGKILSLFSIHPTDSNRAATVLFTLSVCSYLPLSQVLGTRAQKPNFSLFPHTRQPPSRRLPSALLRTKPEREAFVTLAAVAWASLASSCSFQQANQVFNTPVCSSARWASILAFLTRLCGLPIIPRAFIRGGS
jgi:hypothetical protein